MTFQAATAIAGLAAYVMASAVIAKKRITVRGKVCQTCHNPRDRCTCRWL
ncbi:MAG TPA: hypothetical protein VJQ85_02450 [Gaiellaceae bacterium]|nr:hypothetical protein [Gaiellaceae bacterium]